MVLAEFPHEDTSPVRNPRHRVYVESSVASTSEVIEERCVFRGEEERFQPVGQEILEVSGD